MDRIQPEPRRPGRPTTAARAREKTTLSFRVAPSIKQRLDDARQADGRNLSEEAERRLEASLAAEDAFDLAARLAFGEDNSGAIFLFAHALRAIAPAGAWLDDDAASAAVARGLCHLLKRLRSPDDGHIVGEDGPERRIDVLIYDQLGYELEPPNTSARARWAAEQRRKFGDEIGGRLLRIRRAMKAAQEAVPPRAMAMPAPDDAAVVWEHTIARLIAQAEAERAEHRIEGIRRQIGRLAEMVVAPAYRAHERRLIEFRIATLDDADDAIKRELLDLLASASPEAESA
jgi:hypothetical protein